MDWKNLNFDWNRARAFLVTAEEGSFSAAARALGLAQPTLSRQVDLLEAELGVALFERVGRGLALTPAGQALVQHVRAMGEAATRLSMTAFGQSDDMAGPVVITASDVHSGILLPPILEELRAAEPRIEVHLLASNQASDLLRREADIAIRNFQPTEPELIARKLRMSEARLYASPGYLERIGGISDVADMTRAQVIGMDRSGLMLGVMQQMGLPLTEANITMTCDSFLVTWELVKRGMGMGFIDDRIGDAEPLVTRVLPEQPPLPFPLYLVAHRDIYPNRRLRFVYDFLADRL